MPAFALYDLRLTTYDPSLRPQIREVGRQSLLGQPDRVEFVVARLDEATGGREVGRRIDRAARIVGVRLGVAIRGRAVIRLSLIHI